MSDEAERLLNSEALQKAFDDVRTAIHQRWASTPIRDREGAHELKLMLKLIDDVWANLERAVQDQRLEQLRIERPSTFLGDLWKATSARKP